jgi:hypothetical protein
MKAVKQVIGFPFQFGGEHHSGWLPSGTTEPLPTVVEKVLLNIYICESDGGYLLNWEAVGSEKWGCTWHPTVVEAQAQALNDFGIKESDWRDSNTIA